MHAVTRPNPPTPIAGGALVVHQVPAWSDNLIWLLVSNDRKEAAAVDGPEAAPVLEVCQRLGVELTTILNTHTHPDHVGINADLGGEIGRIRVIGPASRAADIPGLTEGVGEGSRFELFDVPFEVMLTEGHIDGHVSYVTEGAVFSGDTLFGAGCGYLFDGPPKKMHDSLTRLAALPPETLVFCAHEYTQDNLRFAWSVDDENTTLAGRIKETWALRAEGRSSVPSTIELERATNPFLRTKEPALVSAARARYPDRSLETEVDFFAAVRAMKDEKTYKRMSEASLPL